MSRDRVEPSGSVGDLLQLVATLSLQDINDVQANRKGKARQGALLSDEELAFQLYAEEANSLLTVANDAILASSIDEALKTDCAIIRQMVASENVAIRDRQLAMAMAQGRAPPTPASEPAPAPLTTAARPGQIQSTSSSRSGVWGAGGSHTGSVVTFVRTPAADVDLPYNECVICMEKIKRNQIRAPCGHYYDLKCLIDLFKSTLTDESLFPPRCCQQPFVFDELRPYFDLDLAIDFEKKSLEFSVGNRVYCYQPTCSSFLGPATDTAAPMVCDECFSHTCGHCKEASHGTSSCSAKHDAAVLDLAEREGWKRCPGCHRLVELTMGCYHMTCICRKQFCYVCTETWKTCHCPQWEENRLLDAATDRVNRQIGRGQQARAAMANNDFGRRVAQEAERLRTNHHCEHNFWQYRAGGGRCEWCNFNLPTFLLRCRGCETLACVRCRRNRV
ncbi:hypothetical protein BXZ70DRAFT_1000275 [Cristinia sonorae]|uniref:RBR-type E3 ubiquitin transferase n=1 Tax=Cristinia sonorae TaxID=1940300 RepID=A0A8K0UMX7_9AGAR|nr:hypothetical protein BXZ70DRAFT_1000275 [Cristinia sonorae]